MRKKETWTDFEQVGVYSSLAKQPQLLGITWRRVRRFCLSRTEEKVKVKESPALSQGRAPH